MVVSPCDAIIGSNGAIRGTEVFQAKGFPYTLADLLGDARLVDRYRGGVYATLRLRSNMCHRFHAPCDARVREVIYVALSCNEDSELGWRIARAGFAWRYEPSLIVFAKIIAV
jgi:hypothetical protein